MANLNGMSSLAPIAPANTDVKHQLPANINKGGVPMERHQAQAQYYTTSIDPPVDFMHLTASSTATSSQPANRPFSANGFRVGDSSSHADPSNNTQRAQTILDGEGTIDPELLLMQPQDISSVRSSPSTFTNDVGPSEQQQDFSLTEFLGDPGFLGPQSILPGLTESQLASNGNTGPRLVQQDPEQQNDKFDDVLTGQCTNTSHPNSHPPAHQQYTEQQRGHPRAAPASFSAPSRPTSIQPSSANGQGLQGFQSSPKPAMGLQQIVPQQHPYTPLNPPYGQGYIPQGQKAPGITQIQNYGSPHGRQPMSYAQNIPYGQDHQQSGPQFPSQQPMQNHVAPHSTSPSMYCHPSTPSQQMGPRSHGALSQHDSFFPHPRYGMVPQPSPLNPAINNRQGQGRQYTGQAASPYPVQRPAGQQEHHNMQDNMHHGPGHQYMPLGQQQLMGYIIPTLQQSQPAQHRPGVVHSAGSASSQSQRAHLYPPNTQSGQSREGPPTNSTQATNATSEHSAPQPDHQINVSDERLPVAEMAQYAANTVLQMIREGIDLAAFDITFDMLTGLVSSESTGLAPCEVFKVVSDAVFQLRSQQGAPGPSTSSKLPRFTIPEQRRDNSNTCW